MSKRIWQFGKHFFSPIMANPFSWGRLVLFVLKFYTQAAQSLGFGIVFGRKWAYGKWPSDCTHKNIAFLELFPIVLGVRMWGDSLANKLILFFTDNDSVVHLVNRQTSKNKELLCLLRQLLLICLRNNILFKARQTYSGQEKCPCWQPVLLTDVAIQNIGPRCWGGSNRCATTPPSAELGEILSSLLRGSISISSLHTYQRPWFIFKRFFIPAAWQFQFVSPS